MFVVNPGRNYRVHRIYLHVLIQTEIRVLGGKFTEIRVLGDEIKDGY